MVLESEFKSDDPGFDPLAEQGEEQGGVFVWSLRVNCVQTCLCLTPFVRTARTHMCVHVKDPISICRKRISRPHKPVVWKHENAAHISASWLLGDGLVRQAIVCQLRQINQANKRR